MNNEPQLPIEKLLDENNTDNIILYNEDGEPVEFQQVALIPIEGQIFVILKPVTPLDGMGEDEVLVFELAENADGEEYLDLCLEDDIIDQVFDVYNSLLEETDD